MEEKKVLVETKELSEVEKEYIEYWMTQNPQISTFRFLPNNQIEVTGNGNMRKIIDAIQIPLTMKGIKAKNVKVTGLPGVDTPLELLSDIDAVKREIETENKNFSMKKFYQSDLQNGIIIITEKEKIFAYSMRLHELAASKIYEYLYGDSIRLEQEPFWQGVVNSHGNIVFQIRGASSIIWLPEKINDFQYHTVTELIIGQQQVEEERAHDLKISLLGHELIPIDQALTVWKNYCKDNDIYQPKVMKK